MLQKLQVLLVLLFAWSPLLQAQVKKSRPLVASQKTNEAKDVLDQTKFPVKFAGYAVHKASNDVVLWFQGTWIEAPAIVGGGSSASWSKRAARLTVMDTNSDGPLLATSFNLGQQEGRWVIRLLRLVPDETKPHHFKPSPLTDEGTGEQVDGSYRFDMEQIRLVIFPRDSAWKPASLRLFRFLGDDFAASAALAPCIAQTVNWGPTQLAPIWAAGSYLLMEDGLLGRLIYRGFGEQGNTWVVRYAREGQKLVKSSAEPFEGSMPKAKGTWPVVGLYQNGLGFGTGNTRGVEKMELDLVFKDPTRLEEVRFDGKAKGLWTTPTMEFTLHGASTEINIPEAVRVEALSRCADPHWMASGGPYSPQKLLNSAFQRCIAQAPLRSVNTANMSWAEIANDNNKQAFFQSVDGWLIAFQESGVQASKILFTRQKPAPLGLILTPEQAEKFRAARAGK